MKGAEEKGLAVPREGRWFAEPRKARRTLGKQPGWWIAFTLPGTVYQTTHVQSPTWVNVAYGLGLTGFLTQSTYWILREALARRALRQDRSFSERPPGIEEFAVELVFSADWRYIGVDRGVVWFDGGMLHFNGAATSFLIAAEDIEPRSRSNDAHKDLPRDALRLRVPKRAAFVRVRPLWGWNGLPFRRRLRAFLRSSDEAKGLRQWPPLTLHGVDAPTNASLATAKEIGTKAAESGKARGLLRIGEGE